MWSQNLTSQELLKVSDPNDDAYIQALEAVNKLNEVNSFYLALGEASAGISSICVIVQVAVEINDRKRAAENMEKVLNLERRLENHKACCDANV
jgi:hypothetical protein